MGRQLLLPEAREVVALLQTQHVRLRRLDLFQEERAPVARFEKARLRQLPMLLLGELLRENVPGHDRERHRRRRGGGIDG